MGAPIPSLGYPSRTEAILALRRQGLITKEIAAKLGITEKNVLSLEDAAARPKKRVRPVTDAERVLPLPQKLVNALIPHAYQRRLTPVLLAYAILETVLTEGMVDAVLDDAEHNGMPEVRR